MPSGRLAVVLVAAARVAREAGPDPDARLALAHRLATGRPPSDASRAAMRSFLDRRAARYTDCARDGTE